MGCRFSSPATPIAPARDDKEGSSLLGVIVWSATDLFDADASGSSSAYCIARVGPASSSWAQKNCCGRRSDAVRGSPNPEWRLGFTVDLAGVADPELQVRVYGKEFCWQDDFLGEAVARLTTLEEAGCPVTLQLTGECAARGGCISASVGKDVLEANQIKPSIVFDELAPMGALKSVPVAEVTGEGPFFIGKAPLPQTLRGVFWLSDQGPSSALVTFGGPSLDGGGCSAGELAGNRYNIRVGGDRVWAFADDRRFSQLGIELSDLVYDFVFDDPMEPKRCQIYPDLRRLGFGLGPKTTWLLDFECVLKEDGDDRYPGSVVWTRLTSIFGVDIDSVTYVLVQVIDENGKRIEPAWSEFVKYQDSPAAGKEPGVIYYRQIQG